MITLLPGLHLFAQETVVKTEEIAPKITARYNVLKSDNKTLNGLYQVYFKKNIPIASGKYDHGKQAGTWHFFDKTGKPVQQFNYDKLSLLYEAPLDSVSKLKYIIDEKFTKADTITIPIRIGGRFFGYLPYLNLFRLPKGLLATEATSQWPTVYIELLISPGGRLADYRVHVLSAAYGEKVLEVDINQLSDEDKVFVPATLNGRYVSSRIVLLCTLTGSRRLEI